MGAYHAEADFVPLSTTNTEDCYFSILPPANVSILVKRVTVSFGTPTGDVPFRVRLRRVSTAQTGTTITAAIEARRTGAPNSVCTAVKKSASTTVTPGTNVDLLLDCAVNGKGTFEWIARDWRDYLESGVNQRIQLTLAVGASNTANQFLEMEWLE